MKRDWLWLALLALFLLLAMLWTLTGHRGTSRHGYGALPAAGSGRPLQDRVASQLPSPDSSG